MPAESTDRPDMTARLGRSHLPTPIVASSGCVGFGRDLNNYVDLSALGAIITKSVFPHAYNGRASPRMAETPSGMLNGIGLQGPGVDALVDEDLPWLVAEGARPVVSVAGTTVGHFSEVASKVAHSPGVIALELNISCPNMERGGEMFARTPSAAADVVAAVRTVIPATTSLLVKLTADVHDIVEVASSCLAAGADGLSLINSLRGMVIDTRRRRPALSGGTGGLTGPAIRPIAVRCIWEVREAHPLVPILGGGGVWSGRDAYELILAGADAVSVGTAHFDDPAASIRIGEELEEILCSAGAASLSDVVGAAHESGGL